jgi:hypothetical protein
MTQTISSTVPATAGRKHHGWFVLDLRRERIDEAFKFFVGFRALRRQ